MKKINLAYFSFADPKIKLFIKLSIFFIACSIIIISLKYKSLPPVVPIFYSLPWGEQQLFYKFILFIFPVMSGLTLLVNIILARISAQEVLIARILILAALVFSLLSVINIFNIVF